MSDFINSFNLDIVIAKNREIDNEISNQVLLLQTNQNIMKVISIPQLGILILNGFGLIQMPIEDKYFNGAIYVKESKLIPVINSAIPRANQFYTAWHEIYHLIFDKVSFNHFIGTDNTIEERKADLFAAKMMLNSVDRYFIELPEMDFVSKICYCMSAFQAPYKAVLISLYEYAYKSNNNSLLDSIRTAFDYQTDEMPALFRSLGLDDSLLKPSYVVNTAYLQEKIRRNKDLHPDLNYHKDNEIFLDNIMKEINLIVRNTAC